MKKRIFSVLLSLCFCVSFLPMGAYAAGLGASSQQSLEHFLARFDWGAGFTYDYQMASTQAVTDRHSRNILEAMILHPSCCDFSVCPGEQPQEFWGERDPLGKWESYAQHSIATVEWALQNIYNCSQEAVEILEQRLLTSGKEAYRLNDYYYVGIGGLGSGQQVRIQETHAVGSRYQVAYDLRNYNGPWEKCYALVEQKSGPQGAYWSLYYLTKLAAGQNPLATGGFIDVDPNGYYAAPVVWAVENGITNGTGTASFSPNMACTRGQIVTFLWNYAGRPEPVSASNPFSDVHPSDYFYKAVLWAVENSITSGTGASSFSPHKACTRGEAVTFLWRSKGRPSGAGTNSLGDVSPDSYYKKAIDWAISNRVTNGTGQNTFSPASICTRGQIVTFLYRAADLPETDLPGWSQAYRDFLLTGRYRTAFTYDCAVDTPWGEMEPAVMLQDMDADGVPELLLSNGHSSPLGRSTYIFTVSDGEVLYIGNGPAVPTVRPGTEYPGVFGEYTQGETVHSIGYRGKVGGALQEKFVYSYDIITGTVTDKTDDDGLFQAGSGASVALYSVTVGTLNVSGWENFVEAALQ